MPEWTGGCWSFLHEFRPQAGTWTRRRWTQGTEYLYRTHVLQLVARSKCHRVKTTAGLQPVRRWWAGITTTVREKPPLSSSSWRITDALTAMHPCLPRSNFLRKGQYLEKRRCNTSLSTNESVATLKSFEEDTGWPCAMLRHRPNGRAWPRRE